MHSTIELKVLGAVELRDPAGRELRAVLTQPKRLALLTYLALRRPQGFVRRDTIVGAFWSDLDDVHARNALSQALRFLRRHLSDSLIIRRGEEEIALNREIIRCDADDFEQACSRDDHESAVRLYGGELLAGFFVNGAAGFDQWLEEHRAHLSRRYARSLSLIDGGRSAPRLAASPRAPTSAVGAAAVAEPNRSEPRLRRIAIVAVAVAGAAVLLGTYATRLRPSTLAKRVVVANFDNQTGDSALTRLGVVAADWITQGLQRSGFVNVVPSGTTLQALMRESPRVESAGGRDVEAVRELARITRASYVINGVISFAGGSLRIQPQIIETSSLRLVGAPSAVLAPRDEPMRAFEQLQQHVMGSLASVLDAGVAGWAATANNPPSLAAFTEFQAGMDELLGQHNGEKAIVHFQRASDSDSSYVTPRLWMLYAFMRTGALSGTRADSIIETVERARRDLARTDALLLDRFQALRRSDREAASRASLNLVALAPTSYFVKMLADDAAFANQPREAVEILSRLDPRWPWLRDAQEYWSSLGYGLHTTGDYARELEVARQSRHIKPASKRYLWLECQALVGLGRIHEVETLLDDADAPPVRAADTHGDFNPDGLLRNVGLELMAHGHREAGLAMLRRAEAWYSARALLWPPNDAERHQHMLTAQELESWADASAMAKSILRRAPNQSMELAIVGIAAAISGDSASARAQMTLLIQSDGAPDHARRLYEAAKIAARLGERDHAVELLRRAFASGQPHTFWDHLATAFEPLRALPAYQELMRPRL